ncbi:hypothetical protein TNCV_4657291 [Trichonephila clavipes]|nr:hypothetical protein TNCV_4657291 [Trichonephila clavipes]
MLSSWVGWKELPFWPQRNPKRIIGSSTDNAPSQHLLINYIVLTMANLPPNSRTMMNGRAHPSHRET